MTKELEFETQIIDNDILAIIVPTEFNAETTEAFDKLIEKHLEDGYKKIIIDFRNLGYLSSLAIGRLVTLQWRLRKKGGEVKLAAVDGLIAEAVRLVGLEKVLDIYGDLEFARESFYE